MKRVNKIVIGVMCMIVLSFGIVALPSPTMVHAQTSTASSNEALIKSLLEMLATLQQQLTQLLAQQGVITSPAPVVTSGGIFEQLSVPEQDLNNTGNPILYRYQISAPKNSDVTLVNDVVYVYRSGVSNEPIVLKVFSDKNFKKVLRKVTVSTNPIAPTTEMLVFDFNPQLTIAAGKTVYVQVETTVGGTKDSAYITTSHKGLSEMKLNASINYGDDGMEVPSIRYVQFPAEDKNVLHAGERATIYGLDLDVGKVNVHFAGNNQDQYVATYNTYESNLSFVVPNLSNGSYEFYLKTPESKKSNVIKVRVVSNKQPYIENVQGKATDTFEMYAGESTSIDGENLIYSGKDADVYVNGSQVQVAQYDSNVLYFTAPNLAPGVYDLYVITSNGKSNVVRVKMMSSFIPAPTCSLGTDKSTYKYGEKIKLSWKSSNATYTFWNRDLTGKEELYLPGDKLTTNGSYETTASVIGSPTITLMVVNQNGDKSSCSKTVDVVMYATY